MERRIAMANRRKAKANKRTIANPESTQNLLSSNAGGSAPSNADLFDNPMVKSAAESMGPEQVEVYKKMGNYMYSQLEEMVDPEKQLGDGAAYLACALRSGLHPSELSENDLNVLEASFGEKWYTKFNYTKKDLNKN